MTDVAGAPAFERRILLAFLAAALLLRLPGHLDSGLWFDEIWLLTESIRVPFTTVLTSFESDNNHPLYTVTAWLSVHALGESAWALRLPAVLFGVASIGMMWKLARRVTDRFEALLATTLLLVSYHHVWFSQNARGYTMLLFWTLAATYFLLETYDGRGRRAWIAYAACLALATFTHASAVFVAAGHGLASLAVVYRSGGRAGSTEERLAPLLGLGLAGVLSLVLHAGMLADMVDFFTGSGATTLGDAEGGPSEWTTVWWTISAVVESLGVPMAVGLAALAAGLTLVTAGTVVVAKRDWRLALLYVLPVVVSVGVTVAMGRSLRPRFLFHFAGFALLIVVAGVTAAADWLSRHAPPAGRPTLRRALAPGAAVLMILASLVILPRAYTLPKQDFEAALAYVRSAQRPGDAVALAGLTVLPYRDYYGVDFPEVRTTEELDGLIASSTAVYVLHTLPIFLETTAPDLARRLDEAQEVARFRGSLGDGDVVVYRLSRASTGG